MELRTCGAKRIKVKEVEKLGKPEEENIWEMKVYMGG
jgi:hypothetical protein